MITYFYKYQGAGNDFILIDDRNLQFDRTNNRVVSFLCDRRFGIGADGLMLLRNHPEYDFEMIYYNSDGKESTMCGNGGRCIVAFANALGIVKEFTKFVAIDGYHEAYVLDSENVNLKMIDVDNVDKRNHDFYLNTGSPHYVVFTKDLEHADIVSEARKIRYNSEFKKEGTNVNFIQDFGECLHLRTYERGVEGETLACGTGAVASAISAFVNGIRKDSYLLKVQGGELVVSFSYENGSFRDIWLKGPAKFVFKGEIIV